MMELIDLPGMSAKFRICRMRTANFKTVGGTLNGNFCAPKVEGTQIPVGVRFCMGGGPLRKKGPPILVFIYLRPAGGNLFKPSYPRTKEPFALR